MKKLIFTLFILTASSMVFTSCTEEEVKPQATKSSNTSGGGSPIGDGR